MTGQLAGVKRGVDSGIKNQVIVKSGDIRIADIARFRRIDVSMPPLDVGRFARVRNRRIGSG